MKILLTGIDGYCGWPLALSISRKFKNCKIIGVDNLARRKWVKISKSVSAINIKSMNQRIKTAKKFGYQNIKFIKVNPDSNNKISQRMPQWDSLPNVQYMHKNEFYTNLSLDF